MVLSALLPADAAFIQSQLLLQESERAGSRKAASAFALWRAPLRAYDPHPLLRV